MRTSRCRVAAPRGGRTAPRAGDQEQAPPSRRGPPKGRPSRAKQRKHHDRAHCGTMRRVGRREQDRFFQPLAPRARSLAQPRRGEVLRPRRCCSCGARPAEPRGLISARAALYLEYSRCFSRAAGATCTTLSRFTEPSGGSSMARFSPGRRTACCMPSAFSRPSVATPIGRARICSPDARSMRASRSCRSGT